MSHKPVSKSEATASVDTKGEMLDSVKNRGEAVTTSPTRSSQSPTAPNPTPIPPQSPKEDSGTSGILIDPTGTYVNNHHVSLTDGQSLQSTCNTSPRATCQIVFTKNDIVKTLQTKQTDSGGAAYWTWSLQSIGLTPGSWIIRTKATLGTQTKQANDALNLEVAP